jgi:hypothetical protein
MIIIWSICLCQRIESEATFWPKFHSLLFLQYWGLMQATCLFGFWPKTFSIIRISCLDGVVRLRHIDFVMKLTRVRNKDIKFRRESRSVTAKKKKKQIIRNQVLKNTRYIVGNLWRFNFHHFLVFHNEFGLSHNRHTWKHT